MEQEGFTGMRTGTDPSRGEPDAPDQLEWWLQLAAWRDSLDRCARKASRKRVHELRIATLRLQAALEYWLSEQAPDAQGVRAIRRWQTQGQKLRRALRPVRETDAYLERLGSLRGPAAGPPGRAQRCSSGCLHEIEVFESEFAHRRKAAADALRAEILERRQKLERRTAALEKVLEPALPRKPGSAAQAAHQLFASLDEQFKDLNEGNLHAYRKGLKKVRYLAETGTDPESGLLAAICRKMLNAAGDWHDWQALAKEAQRLLPGKEGGLAAVLATMTDEALRRALGICQRSRARLLSGGEGQLSPQR
jgi:CHAD domain-containing protein